MILLLAPLFIPEAYADDLTAQAADVFGADSMSQGLKPEERSVSGTLSPGDYDSSSALRRLWDSFRNRLEQEFRSGIAFVSGLLGIVFLCTLSCAVCTQEKTGQMIEIVGACAAAAGLLGDVESLISQTTEAIYRISDYSKAALPVVFTAAAAGGAAASAGARFAYVSLALDVLMSIAQNAVIPLIYTYLCLSLSNMIFPHALAGAICRLAKWAAATAMTGTTLAFTVYLNLTGAISGAVDAAAVKTARSVISGALPVVGSIVSDASAAVLSAAVIVRNCSGVFGLISICSICAGPFALLSIRMLLFKAVAAVSNAVENKRLQALFAAVGTTAAMLMGLLGCSAIMLFLSFSAAMQVVTA